MKRYIKSSSIQAAAKSQGEIIHDLTNKIWDFIAYEMFEQNRMGYYKQVRKQFSVNGRKYVMKNYSNGKLSITNPEGEELYGYSFGGGASRNDAKKIATIVVNDAFGDDTDLASKRVNLKVRANYTSYGRNSGGVVEFGDYVSRLRKHYAEGDPNGRYLAVMIKAWWSSHDQKVIFSDNKHELIAMCQDFIHKGMMTPSGNDSTIGEYVYRFYADVVDTQTGEELYADETESNGAD